jgi:hypothetical protein
MMFRFHFFDIRGFNREILLWSDDNPGDNSLASPRPNPQTDVLPEAERLPLIDGAGQ